MSHARLPFPILLCTLFVAACGDGTGPESPGPPASISQSAGDNQMGTVGEDLVTPLTVHVTDSQGRDVPEVDVEFTVDVGTGSLAAPGIALAGSGGPGGAALLTQPTDSAGNASVIWTLGSSPGTQSVSAEVVDAELDPVTFSATAEVGPPASLAAPGVYAGPAGEPLVGPLVVSVRDRFGNGIAGVTVTWGLSSGSGTLQQTTSQSDGTGTATNEFTSGAEVGLNRIGVTGGGLEATVDVVGMTLTSDPLGDDGQASQGFNPVDITKFGGLAVSDALVVYVEFRERGFNIVTGSQNSVAGFIDIDTDQNPSTGFESIIDAAGLGPSGLGVEHIISFFADDAGRFLIGRQVTDTTAMLTALVPPVFNQNSVTIAVPLVSGLGNDDGAVNMAALLGTPLEATDLAPNQGHVSVSSAGSTVGTPVALRRGPPGRLRGPRWHGLRTLRR